MTETYAGQELPLEHHEMTNDIIKAFEKRYASDKTKTLDPELESTVKDLAEHGSHIARNMLYLTGYHLSYDGQPFEYRTATIHPASTQQLPLSYAEWKDENES